MGRKTQDKITFTEGSIFRSIFQFAVPVLGALILQAAYGAVDLLVVGWFGDAASISAVGSGSAFMQMVTFVITSLAMGSTVVIGRHIGEKRPKVAGDAVGTTVLLFAGTGIVLTILLEVFAGNIAGLLQVPAESFDKTVTYIRICSAGIIVIIAYNVISGILRGVGNANLPFLFVGIACIVNIIGDFVLVGLCGMDVAGAALATIGAQAVSVVISAAVLRKQKLPISFTRRQCRIHLRNHMGLLPSAGYGVAQKIVSFIMLVPSSIMQSVSAFVAQNMGAEKKDRAKRGFFTAMFTGCAAGAVIFCAGFFGGAQLSSLFTGDGEVIVQSANYLKGFSIDCVLTCILFSSIGYFNGCGRSLPVIIQGITSAFFVRIPVSLLMSRLPNPSLTLLGLATPITTVYGILFFMICFWRLKREKTKSQP